MINASPGGKFTAVLNAGIEGLVGELTVQVEKPDGSTEIAPTTEGILEFEPKLYVGTGTAPTEKLSDNQPYLLVWVGPNGERATEELFLTYASPAALSTGPLYATPGDLRSALKVTEEILPDEAATELLVEACDLIDERLGVRTINEETGRKVDLEDETIKPWRLQKLAGATIEVAMVIFSDPDIVRRQRARFSSGDVSVSGFYGPAFGERSEALLNQSGLRVNTARASGGPPRRR